jgi:hypothetical protein
MNGMAPGFPARIASPQVESVEIPQRHSLKQQMKSNQRISSELSLACVSLKFVGFPIWKDMCCIYFWQRVITTERFSSSVNMNLLVAFYYIFLFKFLYIYI